MKYAIVPAIGPGANILSRNAEKADGWWVQFGDTQLIYAAAGKWSDVTNAVGRGDLAAAGNIKKGDMHLVVQKGRTFQQEHPNIPVILDKGRYLVVEVSKARAKKLPHKGEVCFAIEPLAENSVAFDILYPTAKTAGMGVSGLVGALDQATYTADLTHLVSYPTRFSTSPSFQDAANWAEGRLTTMGYATSQTSVNVPGVGTSRNVIATKPGTAASPKQVIVIAHMDSVNHPGGPDAPAPGADDNASGSAGVLSLAGVMAGHTFEHDLVFILCGGEEQGLHGSTQYVAAMSAADKARTKAILNMDMIGHVNTPTQTVLLEGHPTSQTMIDGLAQAATQFTSLTVQSSLNPFASDHVPFIDAGMPAVLTIEGADGANDAIHTGNDMLSRVDPAFALEILRMNVGFLGEAAGIVAQATQPTECGCGSGPSEDVRQLAAHYQMLLAQYARLQAAGVLPPSEVQTMQALRAAHDQLLGQA